MSSRATRLNAFVYVDETNGSDENTGDHPSTPVRTMERARHLATNGGGKCRGIKKMNDANYQQQLLGHPDVPLPCGDNECRPCLRAASIAKCFACGKRTWQQAMKAGLCRQCTKRGPGSTTAQGRMGNTHAQARYNANRRIRRLLNDIRRECEVNDYQAFVGLRLGNQVHTFAFNCCVPTAHGQAIAFHCEDGTVLPQDLDVTNDKSITDSIEKTASKEAVTWHRVRQSLVQWHKSFKTDRQIKDRINKAKKNLKLCQNCIFTVPNEPLEPHASLSEPLSSHIGPHDQPISAATTDASHAPEPQYVGVIVDDQDRAQHPHPHPHSHPHPHPHPHPQQHHHHQVPVSVPQHLPAMKAVPPMPEENQAKRAKMVSMMHVPATMHQTMPQHMQMQMQGMHHMPPMSMPHPQHPPQSLQHPPPQPPHHAQQQPHQQGQQGQPQQGQQQHGQHQPQQGHQQDQQGQAEQQQQGQQHQPPQQQAEQGQQQLQHDQQGQQQQQQQQQQQGQGQQHQYAPPSHLQLPPQMMPPPPAVTTAHHAQQQQQGQQQQHTEGQH